MSQLKEHYQKEIFGKLRESGKFANPMCVPRVTKVVLNIGVNARQDKSVLAEAEKELALVTGQKAVVTRARKSISNFHVREGMPVGAKVTLRGGRMYDFLERFLQTALPRIRDFRGVSPRGFDGRGNYTFGVKDHTIFPEIELDQVKANLGMDVTFVTTATSDEDAKELLKLLGMPFSS